MKKIARLLPAVLLAAAAACSSGPPPREIADARQALQDAKNANADQIAAREYDAALAHLRVAESTWNDRKDGVTATHWARLAEGEARQAQYRAEVRTANEAVRREAERKRQGELSVRDAEIAALQARARTDAEGAPPRRRPGGSDRRSAKTAWPRRMRRRGSASSPGWTWKLGWPRTRGGGKRRGGADPAERNKAAAELEANRAELEASRRAAEEAQKSAEAERQRLEESARSRRTGPPSSRAFRRSRRRRRRSSGRRSPSSRPSGKRREGSSSRCPETSTSTSTSRT